MSSDSESALTSDSGSSSDSSASATSSDSSSSSHASSRTATSAGSASATATSSRSISASSVLSPSSESEGEQAAAAAASTKKKTKGKASSTQGKKTKQPRRSAGDSSSGSDAAAAGARPAAASRHGADDPRWARPKAGRGAQFKALIQRSYALRKAERGATCCQLITPLVGHCCTGAITLLVVALVTLGTEVVNEEPFYLNRGNVFNRNWDQFSRENVAFNPNVTAPGWEREASNFMAQAPWFMSFDAADSAGAADAAGRLYSTGFGSTGALGGLAVGQSDLSLALPAGLFFAGLTNASVGELPGNLSMPFFTGPPTEAQVGAEPRAIAGTDRFAYPFWENRAGSAGGADAANEALLGVEEQILDAFVARAAALRSSGGNTRDTFGGESTLDQVTIPALWLPRAVFQWKSFASAAATATASFTLGFLDSEFARDFREYRYLSNTLPEHGNPSVAPDAFNLAANVLMRANFPVDANRTGTTPDSEDGGFIRAGVQQWDSYPFFDLAPLQATFAAFFFPLVMSPLVGSFIYALVLEKQTKLRQLMNQMGMQPWLYWAVNWIFNMVLWVLLVTVFMLVGLAIQLRMFFTPGITILILLSWGVMMNGIAFLVSVFVGQTRVLFTLAMYSIIVVGAITYFILELSDLPEDFPWWALMLWPPFTFYRAWTNVILTCAGTCLTTADVFSGSQSIPRAADTLSAILQMWIETAVIYLLFFYLKDVVPQSYGIPKHPLWPFFALRDKITGRDSSRAAAGDDASLSDDERVERATPVHPDGSRLKPSEEDPDVVADRRKVILGGYDDAPVVVRAISKQYSGAHVYASNHMSFAMEAGECFGLLGSNGCGKTTTISMMTGLFQSSHGTATIFGHDVFKDAELAHGHIGVCPQFDVHWPQLTVYQHLMFFASLRNLGNDAHVRDMATKVGLLGDLQTRSADLSGGMRRRLSIAMALVGNPPVVFLDEPSTGLDVASRRAVWTVLDDYRREHGATLLLTTHDMEEADTLCSRIMIVSYGRPRALGSPTRLKAQFGAGYSFTASFAVGRTQEGVDSLRRALGDASDGIDIAKLDVPGAEDVYKVSVARGSKVQISTCLRALQTLQKPSVPAGGGAGDGDDGDAGAGAGRRGRRGDGKKKGSSSSSSSKKGSSKKGSSSTAAPAAAPIVVDWGLEQTSLETVFLTVAERVEKEREARAARAAKKDDDDEDGDASSSSSSSSSEEEADGGKGAAVVDVAPAGGLSESIDLQSNYWRQTGALLYKNLLVSWRTKSIFALVVPIIVIFLLWLTEFTASPLRGSVTEPEPFPLADIMRCADAPDYSDDCVTIAYAPENAATTAIVRDAAALACSPEPASGDASLREDCVIQGFEDEAAMEEARLANPRGQLYGILFNPIEIFNGSGVRTIGTAGVSSNATTLPLGDGGRYDYTLFTDGNLTSPASRPDPDADSVTKTPLAGLWRLQLRLDSALLAHADGASGEIADGLRDPALDDIDLVDYPFFAQDADLSQQTSSSTGSLLLFFPPAILSFIFLFQFVMDKELNLRLGMETVGLKTAAYWTSWLVTSQAYVILTTLLTMASGAIFAVPLFAAGRTDLFITFVSFWLFGTAMLALSFMLSAMVSLRSTANNIGVAILLAGLILQLIVGNEFILALLFQRNAEWWVHLIRIVAQILWPPINFSTLYFDLVSGSIEGYDFATQTTIAPLGFGWSNMTYTPYVSNATVLGAGNRAYTIYIDETPSQPPVLDMWGFLALNTLIFVVVGSFIDQVNYYGRSPFFLLSPSTWSRWLQACTGPPSMEPNAAALHQPSGTDVRAQPVVLRRQADGDDSDDDEAAGGGKKKGKKKNAKKDGKKSRKGEGDEAGAVDLGLEVGQDVIDNNARSDADFEARSREARGKAAHHHDDDDDDDVEMGGLGSDTGKPLGLNVVRMTHIFKSLFAKNTDPKNTWALKQVSLVADGNEVLSLLGHNGAGKTTLLNILNGVMKPRGGTALIHGLDVRYDMNELRTMTGLCPQHDILWPELTALEHLRLFSAIKGVPSADVERIAGQQLRAVDLYDVRRGQSQSFSGGMKRRLSVAIASIGQPSVCFMDEPTTGLDPAAKRHVWQLVRRLRERSLVLLTTHSLEEADALSDRVAVMAAGRLRAVGTPLAIKKAEASAYVLRTTIHSDRVSAETNADLLQRVQKVCPSIALQSQNAGNLLFEIPADALDQLINVVELLERGKLDAVRDWSVESGSLESAFVALTSANAGDAQGGFFGKKKDDNDDE